MNLKTLLLPILLLFAFSNNLKAQTAVLDSLKNQLVVQKNDTAKINVYFKIGHIFKYNNPDTALYYYDRALEFATQKGINLQPYNLQKSNALRDMGINLAEKSQYIKALEFFFKSDKIDAENDNVDGRSRTFVSIGNAYVNIGQFEKAIDYYIKALEIFEERDDRIGIADCYNNMGTVLKEQGYLDKAIDYHSKSANIFQEQLQYADQKTSENTKKGLSYCYNNMGIVYWHLDSLDIALDYYLKSLKIKEELNDKPGISQSYNNIAIIYCSQEDFQKGIEYFKKSLTINQEIGNQNGLTMVYGNISYLHLLLAETAKSEDFKQFHYNSALFNGEKAYNIAEKINSLPWKKEAAGHLMNAYSGLGQIDDALKYANIFIQLQDQLFSTEKTKALAEMTTRYEVEKKQFQIESMEKERELNSKTIQAQRVIIVVVVLSLIVVVIFLFVFIRLLKQKREANSLLENQKQEINQQKEEILTQLEEIETQRDKLHISKQDIENLYQVAIEQKSILEKQKRKIDDSIHYAQFIQSAVLPDLDINFVSRSRGIQSYFIMFRPKDIVSGDFYWATRIKDWLIVTVADCTGHGVPGAFMSMLGISFLNEIVLKGDVINPKLILSTLRSYIISALKQTDSKGSQRDGMDMSVTSINTKTKKCLWAGANSPLWIVRANSLDEIDDAKSGIEEIRPNAMPVAVHMNMDEYTEHDIQLYDGDRVFLFSDGYADQFGGPLGKKFGFQGGFKQLILKTSLLRIKEQGKELERAFDEWVNPNNQVFEQVDDVTVLGIVV